MTPFQILLTVALVQKWPNSITIFIAYYELVYFNISLLLSGFSCLIMDELKINHAFAKNYNKYRKAEELQKLKDRYGKDAHLSNSSSESDDDLADGIKPTLQKDFFNTLASIKRKDPVIYKADTKFYSSDEDSSDDEEEGGQSKAKPMLLKDYERKVVLEKGGMYVDDDDENDESQNENHPLSNVEELKRLKNDLISATKQNDSSDSDNSDDGDDFLTKKDKPENSSKDETNVLDEIDSYWKKPNLDEGEAFLRDYILNKKYKDSDDEYDDGDYEDLEDDDDMFLRKQDDFEHNHNFRFQEQDNDYIKTYPRKIENSVRITESKKKIQRQEKRKIKEEAKRKKAEELKRLKQLKRQEIEEKLAKLKGATGNLDVEFNDDDVDGDFNADEHDKRMQKLFNEEFYDENEDEKPVFSDMEDEYVDDNDWDEFQNDGEGYNEEENLPDCEDPDFVMDCDYENAVEEKKTNEKASTSVKNNRNKKSPFFQSLAKSKPLFDPDEKTFEEYLDEYYALDFEDLIGDMQCRFKYKKVPKNDFGLSTDDILNSDNATLNSWCSMKAVVRNRNEEEEERLKRKFQRKSKLKKLHHFSHLYDKKDKDKDSKESTDNQEDDANVDQASSSKPTKSSSSQVNKSSKLNSVKHSKQPSKYKLKKKGLKAKKLKSKQQSAVGLTDERLKAYGL